MSAAKDPKAKWAKYYATLAVKKAAKERNLAVLRSSYEEREDRWVANHLAEILENPERFNGPIVVKARTMRGDQR